MGLLGYWVVLLLRAMVDHPAENILASPLSGRCCCLQVLVNPRLSVWSFRGCIPTAHSLACLRIAGSVTATIARLATGWAAHPSPDGARTRWTTTPNFVGLSLAYSLRSSIA